MRYRVKKIKNRWTDDKQQRQKSTRNQKTKELGRLLRIEKPDLLSY